MKKSLFTIALVSAVVAVSSVTGCRKAPTNTSSSGLATIVCDESFENIMDQEIDVFEYNTKGKANIIPYYVSEKACVDSLLDLKTKTIVITRELTEKETEYLKGLKKMYVLYLLP